MTPASTPALEMLWEDHDPGVALSTRFGFTDAAAAGDWVTDTVSEWWGVRVHSCDRIVMSGRNALAWVRTPRGRMIAKWSAVPQLFPRLAALARLTVWLDGRGLPVNAPVVTPAGRCQIEVDGASLSLQPEVSGDLLNTRDADAVRAAGTVLARLHTALAAYPDTPQIPDMTARSTLTTDISHWLDTAPDHIPRAACDALRHLLATAPEPSFPLQLVHGDFRSANVLCVGSEVTAVLDFEDARLDHRVVEVARSAVLLGTRYRSWGPVSAEVRSWLLTGYQREHRLTPAELAWWDILVAWHSLMMVPPGEDPTGWRSAARG